ncbi:MAG: hypothetical protein J3K34DRAFT_400940 [Monoraphidium minutum]|nr:MAG: hypothetical protein J3K34DRAFT_400940 [Monoraphidium minutum]
MGTAGAPAGRCSGCPFFARRRPPLRRPQARAPVGAAAACSACRARGPDARLRLGRRSRALATGRACHTRTCVSYDGVRRPQAGLLGDAHHTTRPIAAPQSRPSLHDRFLVQLRVCVARRWFRSLRSAARWNNQRQATSEMIQISAGRDDASWSDYTPSRVGGGLQPPLLGARPLGEDWTLEGPGAAHGRTGARAHRRTGAPAHRRTGSTSTGLPPLERIGQASALHRY